MSTPGYQQRAVNCCSILNYICRVKKLRISLLVALLAVMVASCTEYGKILKSKDLDLKYDKAIEYFEEGQYFKAYPLIEELYPIYRGSERAERLYYIFCYCDYNLGDYLLAGHRFRQFTKTFPTSKYTEECAFMSAYCYYLNSPPPSLEQIDTRRAINELQVFMSKYPETARRDSCNTLIQELHMKLEDKAFDNAKQYLHTRYYKSAIVAFDNLLKDYPDTRYREDVMYLKIKSQYLLAQKSILSKKEERYAAIEKQYQHFVDTYPKSKKLQEAESYFKNAESALAGLQKEIPETYIEWGQHDNAIKFLEQKLKLPTNPNQEYHTFLLHKALYLKAVESSKKKREQEYTRALARFGQLEGQVTTVKWAKKVARYRKNLENVEFSPAEEASASSDSE